MAWSAIPVLASTDPFDKPTYDILKADLEYLKGDAAWTAVTFQNSWVDNASGGPPVAFKRVGDFVVLRGVMKSGTLGSAAFTLPVGYRPLYPTYVDALGNAGAAGCYLAIDTAGVVIPAAAANTFIGLNNISIPVV